MHGHKNPQWKYKVQEIFQVCQDEIKRTAEIGKRMLSASKTNSQLHESYEELGQMALEAIKKGVIEWENPRVKELINQIESFEKDLEEIEGEVNKIKFSSAPEDISSHDDESNGKSPQK